MTQHGYPIPGGEDERRASKARQPRFPLIRAIACVVFSFGLVYATGPLTQSTNRSVFWLITCAVTFTIYCTGSSVVTIMAVFTELPKRGAAAERDNSWLLTPFLWALQVSVAWLAAYGVAISLMADGVSATNAGILGKLITTAGMALPPLASGVRIREWWMVLWRLVALPFRPAWRWLQRFAWSSENPYQAGK